MRFWIRKKRERKAKVIAELVETTLCQTVMEKFINLLRLKVVTIQRHFRGYLIIREARMKALRMKWLYLTHNYRRNLRRSILREDFLMPKNIFELFLKLYIKLKTWEYWSLVLTKKTPLRKSLSIQSTDSYADLEIIDRALGKNRRVDYSNPTFTIFSDTEGLREIQQMAMQNRFQWDRISTALEYDDVPNRQLGYKKKLRIILPQDTGFRGSHFITIFTSGQPVATLTSLISGNII